MPTNNTRDREEAKESNVTRPVNPLFQYDKAIFKMLKKLYDEVYYVDTYENAFKLNAKAHQGKVVLPMISVYRLGDYSIAMEAYNDWAVRQGFHSNVMGRAEFPNQRVAAHTLPVTLQYQIDVWATRRDVVDGLTAELLMEFKEHPHFSANIQDLGLQAPKVEFDFLIDENVTDNSGITEFEDTGRYYRLTLTGTVPMAAIFRIDIFNRIEKETITFTDFIEEGKPVKQITNKISHIPEDTLVVENGFKYDWNDEVVEDNTDSNP